MTAKKPNGKAPAPKPAGPPYEMTVEEETEMLARWRFKPGDLDHEIDKCTAVLDEIGYEVGAIAEGVRDVLHGDHGDGGIRKHTDSLVAYARSLGDVSARMLRYAGRLEAYRDAEGYADKAEEMIEAWKNGGLGNPAPGIEVGRTALRMRDGKDGAE